jgi:hydroxypyruvate reductase
LLPAPIEGVSLEDKATTIRRMSLSGAGIEDLNCVRRQLSRIKGGGLARACRAQWLITLVISDVIGDPLEVIASGPTIDFPAEPQQAWELLQRYAPGFEGIPSTVVEALQMQIRGNRSELRQAATAQRHVAVVGNNETAVRAAERAARERGLTVQVTGIGLAGQARAVGRELADRCLELQPQIAAPLCLISGGEPVVRVEKRPGPQKGGRNQELALAAMCRLIEAPARGITILSGGTDGEDGPTDAAGAIADERVIQNAEAQSLDPRPFLDQHNSYQFFERTGGLLKTGPTHTNVMDLRVALIEPLPGNPSSQPSSKP